MRDKTNTKVYHPPVEKDGPLTRDDVLCPVCWSILIEPVTFPCAHSICLLCFRNTVKEACLNCPCCRVRISNWSRKAGKNGTLINQKLWERIQDQFPKFVQARQDGLDSQDVLAEINSEEASGNSISSGCETNGVDSQEETPEKSLNTPEISSKFIEICGTAEKLRKEVADVDAQLIRKFKVEDGFATQQLIFDDDEDIQIEDQSLDKSVIDVPGTSVHVKPIQLSQSKVNGSQGKALCRNLFSEWEMRTEMPADKSSVRKSQKVTASSVKTSSSQKVQQRTPRKRLIWKEPVPSAKTSTVTTPKKSDPPTSSKLITEPKDKMASSFVAVYSPRLITAELPKAAPNGASKLDEPNVLDPKSKQLDHIKRSHFHTSDTPDSINIEVNSHFRPIRSAPRTPPKQLPDGSFLPEPKLVKSTPTRLAPAPGPLSSLLERENCSQGASVRHSSTSTISEDSEANASVSVPTSAQVLSPPPPALVHYAFQGVSPNGYTSDTQEDTIGGRVSGPPPELEAYGDASKDGLDKERRLSEMMYRQVQAYQLEQFRKRKLQEDSDRDYAEKLQRDLNRQGPKVVRTRGSTERYSIRNWDGPSQSSSSSSHTDPSSSVPVVRKYTLRTTRAINSPRKSPPKPSTPARKGKTAASVSRKGSKSKVASKIGPRRSTARKRAGRK